MENLVIRDYAHALELEDLVEELDDLAEEEIYSSAENFKKCLAEGVDEPHYVVAGLINDALNKWYAEHPYCVENCNNVTVERFATQKEADDFCMRATKNLPLMIYIDD